MALYEEYAKPDLVALKRALRRTGMSYQAVADEATKELRKIERQERRKRRAEDVPGGVSKALVGQIAKGAATHELRALAIERALGVNDGDVFAPRVLRGASPAHRLTA